jgi:hypothetical protein
MLAPSLLLTMDDYFPSPQPILGMVSDCFRRIVEPISYSDVGLEIAAIFERVRPSMRAADWSNPAARASN